MRVTSLPEDLKIELFSSLGLFDYRTTCDLDKAKVNLLVKATSFFKDRYEGGGWG